MNHKAPPFIALMETERYHERALRLLTAMHEQCKQNLEKRGYDSSNASVFRRTWRDEMCNRFGIGYLLASQIETNLQKLGRITLLSSYVVPAVQGEVEA
ncbi:MAG: hypothetical protein KGI50_07260 [Patescibacteria group bacterium]|nr:hypothetical protein [Patescibacteria group bacterium]